MQIASPSPGRRHRGAGAATLVRHHSAWLLAVGFEATVLVLGLITFVRTRYLGGTLLALICLGMLMHPAVSRAFARPQGTGTAPGQARLTDGRLAEARLDEQALADNAGHTLGV